MKKTLIITLVSVALLSVHADDSLNLLKNANFAKFTDKGVPESWDVYGNAEFKQENGELKITIKDNAENVSITQKIAGLPADTKLILSGTVKSSKGDLAYLQIKLKLDKKELERKQTEFSTPDGKELKLEFSTGDSNNVTVICRFSKERQQAGDSIWIKNLKLVPAN